MEVNIGMKFKKAGIDWTIYDITCNDNIVWVHGEHNFDRRSISTQDLYNGIQNGIIELSQ